MPRHFLPDWVKSQTAQLCQNSVNSEWVPKQNLLVSSQLYSHKMLNEWDTSGSWGSQLRIAALGFSTKIPPDFNFMPSSPFFRQSPKRCSWHSCQNISSIEARLFLSSLKMACTYMTEKSEQIISVRAFLRANMIIHLLNNNSVNIYFQRIPSLYSNHTILFSDQIWSRFAIDFHNVIYIQHPTVILEPTLSISVLHCPMADTLCVRSFVSLQSLRVHNLAAWVCTVGEEYLGDSPGLCLHSLLQSVAIH